MKKIAHRHNIASRNELSQKKLDAGLMSEKYPQVSEIVILMTYYQKQSSPILMKRTVNFFPTSSAYFHMKCMIKDCVEGDFDLTSIISNLIKKRKRSVKGEMYCKGGKSSLPADHAHISYKINIKFNRKKSR